MGLKDDLDEDVTAIFRDQWSTRDGKVVPDEDDIGLGNDGVRLDATVLYADLAGSTEMVKSKKDWAAAEIYKAFLLCAAKIIRNEGGEITAYDGDRVMAVFIGDGKNTTAIRTGLKINWAKNEILKPKRKECYPDSDFVYHHVVGIDASPLLVARTGVRGANDLVWVGRSANYAAKLSALSHAYSTYITEKIYNNCNEVAKMSKGKDIWIKLDWNGETIYGSTYQWSIS